MTTPALDDPKLFLNRELSWLAFNRRVLEEAQDPSQPLLERLRFLGITASNLDEFFEVRVAGIKQQIEHESDDSGPDGMSPRQTFAAIRQEVLRFLDEKYELWHHELRPALAEHGIHLHDFKQMAEKDRAWASQYFRDEVFPVLTPLAVDASHPFPHLQNKSHNLFLRLARPERRSEALHAVVQIPRVLPRLVLLPSSKENEWHYVQIQNLIQAHVRDLFPGLEVEQVYGFRVTRNSDLYIDEEEAENLLRTIEDELRKRAKGNAVRLEIEHGCPPDMCAVLLNIFKLTEDDIYFANGPLNFLHLMPLASIEPLSALRDKPYIPVASPAVPHGSNIFEIMRQQDVLLHHPYESFSTVVDFLEHAAADPQVLAIKMTLYRTSGDSPIVQSLIRAAEEGKQVTALVELRARFDEANNINWARQLERCGRPRRLRARRVEDPLQGADGRPPRRRPAAAISPSRHRQLQPQHRALLHRPERAYLQPRAGRGGFRALQHAHRPLRVHGREAAHRRAVPDARGVPEAHPARARPGPGGQGRPHHREAQFAGGGKRSLPRSTRRRRPA